MMRYTFFFIPIYLQSKEEYDLSAKRIMREKTDWIENDPDWKIASKESKERLLESHRLPNWEYNAIAGYLKLGMDGETSMVGKIYLQRKYFPKGSTINDGSGYRKPLEKQKYFEFSEIKLRVRGAENCDYIGTFTKIIADTSTKVIKKGWFLDVPGYGPQCFDFKEAYMQLKDAENHGQFDSLVGPLVLDFVFLSRYHVTVY